jgi:hypothetical protein
MNEPLGKHSEFKHDLKEIFEKNNNKENKVQN